MIIKPQSIKYELILKNKILHKFQAPTPINNSLVITMICIHMRLEYIHTSTLINYASVVLNISLGAYTGRVTANINGNGLELYYLKDLIGICHYNVVIITFIEYD